MIFFTDDSIHFIFSPTKKNNYNFASFHFHIIVQILIRLFSFTTFFKRIRLNIVMQLPENIIHAYCVLFIAFPLTIQDYSMHHNKSE